MEDDLEDKVLYQTYVSHMKIFSKFAVGLFNNKNGNSSFAMFCRFMRINCLRPEVLVIGIVIFLFCFYLQAIELSTQGFLSRLSSSFRFSTKSSKASGIAGKSPAEKQSWSEIKATSAVYCVQGRRGGMEDRFVIDENINNSTGISMFAIFDGHGGEMAADYAKDVLCQNLYNKILETSQIVKEKIALGIDVSEQDECEYKRAEKVEENILLQRKPSMKKGVTKNEDYYLDMKNANNLIDSDILSKLPPQRPTKEGMMGNSPGIAPVTKEAKCYIEKGPKINFGRLITDEVLAADYKLVEKAKRQINVAGTTALIAVLQGTKLVVANVGDSRGVMCDAKGNAIPLSFDHKPQSAREHRRIQEAGGFIAFKGVWRVSGILATSRALGDYPLKPKLVIADPDILTFELADHKPSFLILASDGLWDTFSNEDAVSYIRDHIDEPHFGAKSITLQSYARGSVDNISVLVIRFKNGLYEIQTSDGQ